jgi:hypothetical protein
MIGVGHKVVQREVTVPGFDPRIRTYKEQREKNTHHIPNEWRVCNWVYV